MEMLNDSSLIEWVELYGGVVPLNPYSVDQSIRVSLGSMLNVVVTHDNLDKVRR